MMLRNGHLIGKPNIIMPFVEIIIDVTCVTFRVIELYRK